MDLHEKNFQYILKVRKVRILVSFKHLPGQTTTKICGFTWCELKICVKKHHCELVFFPNLKQAIDVDFRISQEKSLNIYMF